MTLAYQRFTGVLLLICGSLFLSGVYYCPGVGVLHHNNAPAHTALPVREFLVNKQINVMEYRKYSPDRAPSDFILFLKIKRTLKGRQFNDRYQE
jgi:transposase